MKERDLAHWRARHIGLVFQFYNLIPVLTAFENVELPLLLTDLSKAERKQHVETALKVVGLADRMSHYPRQLSGGQEQRVAIARAIVTDPTIVVADEPTGDLDAKSAEEILNLLVELNRDVQQDHHHGDARSARGAFREQVFHLDKGILAGIEPGGRAPATADRWRQPAINLPRRGGSRNDFLSSTGFSLCSDRCAKVQDRKIMRIRAEACAAIRVKYLALIFKNLTRNKKRTVLTVFSIAVSLFIFSALVSLPDSRQPDPCRYRSLGPHRHPQQVGTDVFDPIAYRQKIAVMPHVVATSSQSWFGGILHDVNDQFPNMAMDHDQADIMFPDWGLTPEAVGAIQEAAHRMRGRHRHDEALQPARRPADHSQGHRVSVQRDAQHRGRDERQGAAAHSCTFRRDYLEEAAGRPGFVSNIWVRADKSENVPQLIAAIDEQFANSSAETQSESEAAFIGSFMRQYKTMFTPVRSARLHRRDHGRAGRGEYLGDVDSRAARRDRGDALDGISSRQILSTLLAESLVIGLMGGLLGCGAAFLALKLFARPQDGHALDSDAAGGAGGNTDRGRHHRIRQRMDSGALGPR